MKDLFVMLVWDIFFGFVTIWKAIYTVSCSFESMHTNMSWSLGDNMQAHSTAIATEPNFGPNEKCRTSCQ